MYSDTGEFVGRGENRFFHHRNARILVYRFEQEVTVSVHGGNFGDDEYDLTFTARLGESLKPGVYNGLRNGRQDRGGMRIGGNGRGCNDSRGRFELKDLAYRPDGFVERLWVVYEQRCDESAPALVGEVRLGIPTGDARAFTVPTIVRWPAADFGRPGKDVPVTFVATEPMHLGAASVAGATAGDFPIRADDCAGKSLGAGEQCQVSVGFTPAAAGTRLATLRIPRSDGRASEVALQGFSYGGRTRLVMSSDAGDWIGDGQSYSYTPANAVIHPTFGAREGVRFYVNPASGGYWEGNFSPAEGGVIAPGHYAGATRDPFRGSAPGIEVTGNNRGCNTMNGEFTVHEATYNSYGHLQTISLDFVQHCNGEAPALRGTWEHRAGDTTPPAPWMDGGSWATAPPVDGEPGGGSAGADPPAPWTTPAPLAERPKSGACSLRRFASLSLLKGTPDTDRLRGTRAAEILFAGRGNDAIRAGGGNDCADGGHHRDSLNGGTGSDYLSGESGNDRLDGGPGRDFLNCGAGRDVAVATRGDRTKSCERVLRPRRKR
jgi:hypothetical protein